MSGLHERFKRIELSCSLVSILEPMHAVIKLLVTILTRHMQMLLKQVAHGVLPPSRLINALNRCIQLHIIQPGLCFLSACLSDPEGWQLQCCRINSSSFPAQPAMRQQVAPALACWDLRPESCPPAARCTAAASKMRTDVAYACTAMHNCNSEKVLAGCRGRVHCQAPHDQNAVCSLLCTS